MKKKLYNIIIYVSLSLALVFVILACLEYDKDKKVEQPKVNETNTVVEEIIDNEEPQQEEPQEMINIDKHITIKKYIDSIADGLITNEKINIDMVNSWENYEVKDVIFLRMTEEGYYSYKVNIKIYGQNATLPKEKNQELSTDEYTILTMNFNLYKTQFELRYNIKSLEI